MKSIKKYLVAFQLLSILSFYSTIRCSSSFSKKKSIQYSQDATIADARSVTFRYWTDIIAGRRGCSAEIESEYKEEKKSLDDSLANLLGAHLLSATAKNKVARVQELIEIGANINYFNQDGKTAVMIAVLNCDDKCLKLLLDKGADANIVGDQQGLRSCCEEKSLAHFNVGSPGGLPHSLPPLMRAINLKNISIVKILCDHNANINYQDKQNGFTPLMIAVMTNELSIVKFLIDRKANINVKSIKDSLTPLICAAYLNDYDLVELLLSKGADPQVAGHQNYKAIDATSDNHVALLLRRAMLK